jgi:hypothetical protein
MEIDRRLRTSDLVRLLRFSVGAASLATNFLLTALRGIDDAQEEHGPIFPLWSRAYQLVGTHRRWADLAGRELERSRAVAKSLFVGLFDSAVEIVIAKLAQSSELRLLVREQSMGLSESALRALRTQGASADDFADQLVRKILHRSKRGAR